MPDIFLSYNREDQATARLFAEAFEREGFDVWWDTTLRTGEAYDKVTEQALSDATAVVVLWSPRSVDSRWVRAEATQALRYGTLAPVMIEPCKRPIMFELTQTAELSHWRGDPSDNAWLAFMSDVRQLVGKEAPAPSASTTPPEGAAAPRLLHRPLVLGAIALAAVAVIAIAGMLVVRPQALAPASQRIAFFGFAADVTDLAAVKMAKAASDETYKTLNALGLETASEAETRGTVLDQQLARANVLGASYALGGEVVAANGGYSISIRLDDATTRATLWKDTVSEGPADKISTPVRAAARATGVVKCVAEIMLNLKDANAALERSVARGCADSNESRSLDSVERWRVLAGMLPNVANVQSAFAVRLRESVYASPLSERPALIEEAKAAAQRALAIDPTSASAGATLAFAPSAQGRRFSEVDALLKTALQNDSNDILSNVYYRALLIAVGRYREAQPYANAAVASHPLGPLPLYPALGLMADLGQPIEAGRGFERAVSRLPTADGWDQWMFGAVFQGVSDPAHVLNMVPSMVRGDAIECWRAIAAAFASTERARRQAGARQTGKCLEDGNVSEPSALASMAILGDVDTALKLYRQRIDTTDPLMFVTTTARIFRLAVRPLRADPAFLPLVKDVGIFQYWIDTGKRPDVCLTDDEKGYPFCVALEVELAKTP